MYSGLILLRASAVFELKVKPVTKAIDATLISIAIMSNFLYLFMKTDLELY